jgi:hypothetical protein
MIAFYQPLPHSEDALAPYPGEQPYKKGGMLSQIPYYLEMRIFTPGYGNKRFLFGVIFGTLLFGGGGIGLLIQGAREFSVKQALHSASPCPLSHPAKNCLLESPAIITGHYTFHHARGGTEHDVYLSYIKNINSTKVAQLSVETQGGRAYRQLQDGEDAKITFFGGHLIKIQVAEGTIKPTWDPGRYWVHLLVGLGCLIAGLFSGWLLLSFLKTKKKIGLISSPLDKPLQDQKEKEDSLSPSERYKIFVSDVAREGVMFSTHPKMKENGEEVFALWSNPDTAVENCKQGWQVIPFYTQKVSDSLHSEGKVTKNMSVTSLWDALKNESKACPLVIYPTLSSPGKRVSEEELRRDLEG